MLKLVELFRGYNCMFWSKCGMCMCVEIRSDDVFRLSPYKGRKQNNILNLKRRKLGKQFGQNHIELPG